MTDSRRRQTKPPPDDRDAVYLRWLFAHFGVSGKSVAPTAILLCGMILVSVIIIVWILSH